MHWGVGVLDRARKLHLRAPLLGGGIAVHEATVAQVEVPSSKTAVVKITKSTVWSAARAPGASPSPSL